MMCFLEVLWKIGPPTKVARSPTGRETDTQGGPLMLVLALSLGALAASELATPAAIRELKHFAETMVSDADTDNDGRLHFDDFTNALFEARKAFEGPDVQKDGECLCHFSNLFMMIDSKMDDHIDSDELREFFEALDLERTEKEERRQLYAGKGKGVGAKPATPIPFITPTAALTKPAAMRVGAATHESGDPGPPWEGHDQGAGIDPSTGEYVIPAMPGGANNGQGWRIKPEDALFPVGPGKIGGRIRPLYEGQSKIERWHEIWGRKHDIPGPRDPIAPHNKPVPEYAKNKGRPSFRECIIFPGIPPLSPSPPPPSPSPPAPSPPPPSPSPPSPSPPPPTPTPPPPSP